MSRRTKIQQIIIPRNWLFGRIAMVQSNLRSLINNSSVHFTGDEIDQLKVAIRVLNNIQKNKNEQSGILKESLIEKK